MKETLWPGDPAGIRSVHKDQVPAAISALGFDPHDVYEVRITLHEVRVFYHSRYGGQLTGGSAAQTIPVDRRPRP